VFCGETLLAENADRVKAINDAMRRQAKSENELSSRKHALIEQARSERKPDGGALCLPDEVRDALGACAIQNPDTGQWEWHRRTGRGRWAGKAPLEAVLDRLEHQFTAPENKRTRVKSANATRRKQGDETRERVLAAAAKDARHGRVKRIAAALGLSRDHVARILKKGKSDKM